MKKRTHNTQHITHNRKPLVSVIMPVYNAGEFLRETVNSVFNQTYENIEVVAVNDGSTDNSSDVLKEFAKNEPRLKIINNPRNLGVGKSANIGLNYAKGDFIARVDSDDLIPSDRIQKQLEFLLANPEVVVVGGQVELVTEVGSFIVQKHFPLVHEEIIKMSFTAMPIQQGAMMVNRKRLPKDFVWYRNKYKTSEDLDFFYRVFQYGKGANLRDIILYYRQHGQSITQAENPKDIYYQAFKVRFKAIKKYEFQVGMSTIIQMIFQYLLVIVLPTSLIYPLYYLWRGLKPFTLPKINFGRFLQHAVSYII